MPDSVMCGDARTVLRHGDCLEVMRSMPADSVDLIFGSPPYENCRDYGIDFALQGQDWVDWMVKRWREMRRICKGVVCMVVEGQTRDFSWSATPFLLGADLKRAGFFLRKPPLYERWGVSGTGGPDWLRNRYEFIICTSKGRLPWSANTACGHPIKYKKGGVCSNRRVDGTRCKGRKYAKPRGGIANPGNIIDCGAGGGGHMGSRFAHEGEAPFPETLAEFFVKSFCPPGGIVMDPFCGSGTTLAVALKHGRKGIGIDIRESQVALTRRRLEEAAAPLTHVSDREGERGLFEAQEKA